ncbi:DUF6377 domain-containing protein [Alistipes sp.]|uniref:DUF6377 domain-containing protein n=1 Tax=Alistipes sp. TaxID=1872444 RepID=UPI0025BFD519|nr:DUF6377 domain-containing protein [Alistipes sp.]MCI7141084.1 DUF6377 domain-containing protein [Alistipes sp.]MDY5395828.1 DUF6377 domain-containing protein [Alistipes sp.]
MKFPKPAYRIGRILVLLFCLTGSFACGRNETRSLEEELDTDIRNRKIYERQKEARIDKLRSLLRVTGLSPRQEFEINARLCQEFWKYKLDSAIRYAERNLAIARELHDRGAGIATSLHLAQLYSFSGKSLETKEILDTMNRASLPDSLRATYYQTYSLLYGHYAAISNQTRYNRLIRLYEDSTDLVLDTASFEYRSRAVGPLVERGELEEARTQLFRLLEEAGEETPRYAQIACGLGSLYQKLGDERRARQYYMLSAKADVRNATKENASFQELARMSYAAGNLSDAFKYAQAAIEDAQFSNVQFRTAQMAELYSIINAAYQAKEARAKSKLQHYILLISLLSAVLAVLFVYLYQQLRKLSRTQIELSRANASLRQLNDELADKNRELSESNDLKEQYIARFFDLCSLYIDKMDGYRKSLYRLAQNRQFDELYKRLKSTSMMENEVDELYKNFDAVFLNLYPTFVADFNALLADEERIRLRPGELLNKELRIYALLRLGITDSSKIAAFLRCSLSTVYNYRTRMRNRASVSKEEFERRISEIGNSMEKEGS